jgi:hypothetical protein
MMNTKTTSETETEIKYAGTYKQRPVHKIAGTDLHLLPQNQTSQSIFGQAQKTGLGVLWIVDGMPARGTVKHTGCVMIDGKKMSFWKARVVCINYLNRFHPATNEQT